MFIPGTIVEPPDPSRSTMTFRRTVYRLRPLWLLAFCALLIMGTPSNAIQEKKVSSRSKPVFNDGDIVFQGNMEGQGAAIAQATRSPYTHCGIIFIENGEPVVWEAVGPVKRTPWKKFVGQGTGGHYVVKRIRQVPTAQQLEAMKRTGEAMMGRPYDIHFQLDDGYIYCSELVYKMYKAAGVEAGALEDFCSMDLEAPIAKAVLIDRFGDKVPCGSQVITPVSLFRSPLLITVDSVGAPPAIP